MKKNAKQYLKKYISSAAALCLCGAMTLSFASCSSGTKVDSTKVPSEFKAQKNTVSDASLHTSDWDNTKKIASSGLINIYLDEDDFTITVKDTTHNKVWSSIPSDSNELAYVASAEILNGDKKYKLNTQDNSVAFKKASAKVEENLIEVTYILTPDQKTAQKKEFGADDIAFELKIKYELDDGSLNVSAKTKNLAKDSKAKLTKLDLLPYFGAYTAPQSGDFIFVPDGSGAIIKTDIKDASFEKPLSFAVYGNDLSVSAEREKYSAIVPTYGMKQGESAFVVLITKGDALATITADRQRENNQFFKVGAEFAITPQRVIKDEGSNELYVSDKSYDNEVSLCLRFLNGSNANYTGMAAASREQLIRDRVLSTKTVKESEYLPLELSIIGAADTKMFKKKGSPSYLKAYTKFEEAQDMVSRMKAKGINGMNIIYKGALSGGLDQDDIFSSKVLRRLGSARELNELIDFIEAQNLGIFLDVNILSSSVNDSFSARNSANNIVGKPSQYITSSELGADAMVQPLYARRLLATDRLKKAIVETIGNNDFNKFTGFCVSDAGSILYSDFKAGKSRQQNADKISRELPPLTAGRTLMTEKGNFFMVKDVEFISKLPVAAQVPENAAYVSVPFVQLILHGIVEYSTEPINYADNSKHAMLRSIEYGACPAYELTYENVSGEKDDIFFYDNWINSAAEFYQKANETLKDVRSSRMTSHSEIKNGVFCTEYDTGEKIYVNYTEDDVVVSGLTIPAEDFLRIN